MSKIKKIMAASFLALLVVSFINTNNIYAQQKQNPVADVVMSSGRIIFNPVVDYKEIVLTVSGPNDYYVRKVFDSNSSPYFDLSGSQGPALDGSYNYELRVTPVGSNTGQRGSGGADNSSSAAPVREDLVQSGGFSVFAGNIANPRMEEPAATMDIQHLDDVIISFSLCVGNDCVNGESFGFDTLRLKENNLRIHFSDTSNSASFPTNDWRIVANDTSNGGANYLAFEDSTAGRQPFRVEAGAPASTLYVEADGDVGIKTSNPVVDLHMVEGNTPTLRLEQDGSDGFTPQTWDVAGNEANFFIRDVTNGSKLSFKIKPGAPTSSLFIAASGFVGMGTESPDYQLEVAGTSAAKPTLAAATTDGGAVAYLRATASQGVFGTLTNHQLRFLVNENWVMELQTDQSLNMVSGASCTAAGVWTDASSRELKENINNLSASAAMKALNDLQPVTFNYKRDKEEPVVGFIAEDVPELVAQKNRKTLSSMDITAVLTKVVQHQQEEMKKHRELIQKLQEEINRLKKDTE